MWKFIFVVSLLVAASLAETDPITEDEEEALRLQQAKEARYSFGTTIEDNINGLQAQHNEKREGQKVTGSYSYNDGFVKRNVHYEADENGYRVVKEELENIGDGPVINNDGIADIDSSITGHHQIKLDENDDKKHYKGINGA